MKHLYDVYNTSYLSQVDSQLLLYNLLNLQSFICIFGHLRVAYTFRISPTSVLDHLNLHVTINITTMIHTQFNTIKFTIYTRRTFHCLLWNVRRVSLSLPLTPLFCLIGAGCWLLGVWLLVKML
jgi:hypothetical protein